MKNAFKQIRDFSQLKRVLIYGYKFEWDVSKP